MKGALTLFLCFWLVVCCMTTAWAQLPEEVEEALPEAAEELLEDLERYDGGIELRGWLDELFGDG